MVKTALNPTKTKQLPCFCFKNRCLLLSNVNKGNMRPSNTVIIRQMPLYNWSNNLTQHRPTFYTFFLYLHMLQLSTLTCTWKIYNYMKWTKYYTFSSELSYHFASVQESGIYYNKTMITISIYIYIKNAHLQLGLLLIAQCIHIDVKVL